ncbi:MAG: hypothetical protein ER33_03495 [Cyanobium sp. CACIAM 14]|nr:MAG: hypothetical protein ER33_03495 [Cyanobium sp. CACIAM 14]
MTPRPPGRLPNLIASLFLLLLVLAGRPGDAAAAGIGVSPQAPARSEAAVVEHLRLRVPAAARDAWLQAERETWEPWLQRQDGFQGRELLWDGGKEEGILLIHWRSRRQWLAIPEAEIDVVQRRFEAAARRALAMGSGDGSPAGDTNPFPLLSSGELEPMGRTERPAAAVEP